MLNPAIRAIVNLLEFVEQLLSQRLNDEHEVCAVLQAGKTRVGFTGMEAQPIFE